jgi:hypothetical protein
VQWQCLSRARSLQNWGGRDQSPNYQIIRIWRGENSTDRIRDPYEESMDEGWAAYVQAEFP